VKAIAVAQDAATNSATANLPIAEYAFFFAMTSACNLFTPYRPFGFPLPAPCFVPDFAFFWLLFSLTVAGGAVKQQSRKP